MVIETDSGCGFIVRSRTRPNVTFDRVTCHVVPVIAMKALGGGDGGIGSLILNLGD